MQCSVYLILISISVQESTFVHNTRLTSLSLAHNLLASVPDLSGLSSLRSLDLDPGRPVLVYLTVDQAVQVQEVRVPVDSVH